MISEISIRTWSTWSFLVFIRRRMCPQKHKILISSMPFAFFLISKTLMTKDPYWVITVPVVVLGKEHLWNAIGWGFLINDQGAILKCCNTWCHRLVNSMTLMKGKWHEDRNSTMAVTMTMMVMMSPEPESVLHFFRSHNGSPSESTRRWKWLRLWFA